MLLPDFEFHTISAVSRLGITFIICDLNALGYVSSSFDVVFIDVSEAGMPGLQTCLGGGVTDPCLDCKGVFHTSISVGFLALVGVSAW